MALTELDPKTALIVIDLQKGILANVCAHSVEDVVKHASLLAKTFRHHDLPVVLVSVVGTAPGRTEQPLRTGQRPVDWATLAPELNQQPKDYIVTKQTWGAFTNTGLEAYLRQQGITQVVMAGIATSIGVESTARYAHECGFNVTLAVDAMTDMSLEAHTRSITQIFPRLGETGTTQEVIDLLNKSEINPSEAQRS